MRRMEATSHRASPSGGSPAKRLNVVGTPDQRCTWCLWISASTPSASDRRCSTDVRPLRMALHILLGPEAWFMGMLTSCARDPSTATDASTLSKYSRSVPKSVDGLPTATPFGKPVVPEV